MDAVVIITVGIVVFVLTKFALMLVLWACLRDRQRPQQHHLPPHWDLPMQEAQPESAGPIALPEGPVTLDDLRRHCADVRAEPFPFNREGGTNGKLPVPLYPVRR
jgi:hypothetical protein